MFVNSTRFRATHQASADAILPINDRRPVTSRGSRFYNVDAWTGRAFGGEMADWAVRNPGKTPTSADIARWVDVANAQRPYKAEIVIASTPDELPLSTALALAGGVYHEALHTLFSRRTPLKLAEVEENVLSRWNLVPNWGKKALLMDMSNLIEDIRIERCGNARFPGIRKELSNLEDLVINQEFAGLDKHPKLPEREAARFVTTCTFRNIGMGYTSPVQTAARLRYKKLHPDAYRAVESGALRPLLDRAMALGEGDSLDCLWLAMDFYVTIFNPEEEAQEEQGQGQGQGAGAGNGQGQGQGQGAGAGDGQGDGQGQGQGQGAGNGKSQSQTTFREFDSLPESWVRDYQARA
jgi:hypothetical protein